MNTCEEVTTTTISDLSDYILKMIFAYAPAYGIQIKRTCKLWHAIGPCEDNVSYLYDWLVTGDTDTIVSSLRCDADELELTLNDMANHLSLRKKVVYRDLIGTPLLVDNYSVVYQELVCSALRCNNVLLANYMYEDHVIYYGNTYAVAAIESGNRRLFKKYIIGENVDGWTSDACFIAAFKLPESRLNDMMTTLFDMYIYPCGYNETCLLVKNGLFDVMRELNVVWPFHKKFLRVLGCGASDKDIEWYLKAAELRPCEVFVSILKLDDDFLLQRMFAYYGWTLNIPYRSASGQLWELQETDVQLVLRSAYSSTEAQFNNFKRRMARVLDHACVQSLSFSAPTIRAILHRYPYDFKASWFNINILIDSIHLQGPRSASRHTFLWGYNNGFRELMEADPVRFLETIDDIDYATLKHWTGIKNYTGIQDLNIRAK